MRPRVGAIVAWLGAGLLCSSVCHAQITFDGCSDINGVPVASVSNNGIRDIAQASILNGRPVIYYNPSVLVWVRPQTRLFFYAHECGHHALGHVLSGLRLGQEQEADCWGVVKLRKLHRLTDQDISVVQSDIARFGRGDWTHLPGPIRAIKLRECLDDTDDDNRNQSHGHWEIVACSHPMHPAGDIWPCEHVCGFWYGQPVPCHPAGDLHPCSHPAHPAGDRVWVAE